MGFLLMWTVLLASASQRRNASEIPVVVELVASGVKQRTIHGWHSSRLVRSDGRLYAAVTVQDDDGQNDWQDRGVFYRREDDGTWSVVGELPHQPYHFLVAPDGRFWVVAASRYGACEVYRSKTPGNLSDMEIVYTGTCAYLGASMSPEGNFLLLHARDGVSVPNAVVAVFYEAATGLWHTSGFPTPEGRCGYEGILLRGKMALAVVNSSAYPPPNGATTGQSTPWRGVRLVKCDDLIRGEWTTRFWLDRPYGGTGLADMIATDHGILLTYSYLGADTPEELAKAQYANYIALVRDDLSVEVHPFGQNVGAGRILRDARGRFFFVGRVGDEYRLWNLDADGGFTLSDERRLVGSAGKLMNYVLHILRPERFGGQDDGDTIHLFNTTVSSDPNDERAYHVSFRLPAP
jgi:hypothetical protein